MIKLEEGEDIQGKMHKKMLRFYTFFKTYKLYFNKLLCRY